MICQALVYMLSFDGKVAIAIDLCYGPQTSTRLGFNSVKYLPYVFESVCLKEWNFDLKYMSHRNMCVGRDEFMYEPVWVSCIASDTICESEGFSFLYGCLFHCLPCMQNHQLAPPDNCYNCSPPFVFLVSWGDAYRGCSGYLKEHGKCTILLSLHKCCIWLTPCALC